MALAVLLAGCATGGGPSGERGAPGVAEEETIVVQNHGWDAVRVYAVRNSARMRLGLVQPMNTRQFELTRSMLTTSGYLQLLVRPIATSQRYLTRPIPVGQGGIINLDVHDRLEHSTYSVFTHELR